MITLNASKTIVGRVDFTINATDADGVLTFIDLGYNSSSETTKTYVNGDTFSYYSNLNRGAYAWYTVGSKNYTVCIIRTASLFGYSGNTYNIDSSSNFSVNFKLPPATPLSTLVLSCTTLPGVNFRYDNNTYAVNVNSSPVRVPLSTAYEASIAVNPISLTVQNTQNMQNVQVGDTIYSNFPATIPVATDTTMQARGKVAPTITVDYTRTKTPVISNTGG